MKQYNVTGMSCAACSARVEKAVGKVEGITSCSVSLLTNSMTVEGTANPEDVISAVEKAGYNAQIKGDAIISPNNSEEDALSDKETPVLKKRLLASLAFLFVLMYFSMGHSMFGLPLPAFFDNNPVANGIIQMLLAIIVMVINQKFFISGFKAVINKAPNMDTLVALGSAASFIYSIYAILAMSNAQANGDLAMAHSFMHEFYFESAAMILALITVGKMLEARSKGKTTNALKSLMKLRPKTALLLRDNKEITVSVEDIKIDDIFIVKPGESIPTDGVIIDGHCAVNEASLTGESIPVDKNTGDNVFAATINQSGFIKCKATKVSTDTTLSQIIKMVSDASASKAPIAKIADKVSGVFVPVVITIALITTIVWLLCNESIGFALARGISVLVISCPCALGLATPVAIMVGNGVGAKNGILFKNATCLEQAGKTQIVALDKTGTITNGEPVVTDIIPSDTSSTKKLLSLAYSLEIKSEHPLATAVVKKAKELGLEAKESINFEIAPGNGLTATIEDVNTFGGNLKFVSAKTTIPDSILKTATKLSEDGKTPLFFGNSNEFLGIIAVADTVKKDSPAAIKELQNMGIKVVMLTGDNEITANAIKKVTGVDKVIAGVLPAGKERIIKKLKREGMVAMVGDGINDAPALTSADIGIAIGAGTDVAIDAADIVLMKSSLMDVPAAIRLSRATLRNIHQNLFWAFIYNMIGIPLAAGLWIPLLGLKLNPMFGAAAMSLSSFCVVTNALRLNLTNIRSTAKDKKYTNKKSNSKEIKDMEKTLTIEGMMCGHCEARVKKCLESLDGVSEAIVSHENNSATVILTKDVAFDVLKNTVEEQGYNVVE